MKTVESAYVDELLKVGPVESVRLIENLLGTLVDLSGKDCWPIVDAKLAIHGSFLRTIRLKATDSISKEVEEAEWQRIMRNWPPERFSPDWCKWAREFNRVYLHSAIFDDLLEEVTRLRVDGKIHPRRGRYRKGLINGLPDNRRRVHQRVEYGRTTGGCLAVDRRSSRSDFALWGRRERKI